MVLIKQSDGGPLPLKWAGPPEYHPSVSRGALAPFPFPHDDDDDDAAVGLTDTWQVRKRYPPRLRRHIVRSTRFFLRPSFPLHPHRSPPVASS